MFLIPFAMVLLQHQIPRLENIPQVSARRFKIDSTIPHPSEEVFFDVAASLAEPMSVIHDGRCWVVLPGPKHTLLSALPLPLPPPPASVISNLPASYQLSMSGFKRRNGKFFVTARGPNGTQILRFDPALSQWLVVLDPGLRFLAFEITFDDRVLVFDPRPMPKDTSAGGAPSPAPVQDPADFFWVFDINGKDPLSKVPQPAEVTDVCNRLDWSPGDLRTSSLEEFILIYRSFPGGLYAYDSGKRQLKTLDVPWPTWTPTRLNELAKRYPDGRPISIDLTGSWPNMDLQWLPLGGGAFGIAYRHVVASKSRREKFQTRAEKNGEHLEFRDDAAEDSLKLSWRLHRYNLYTGTSGEVWEQDPLPKAPIWVDGLGQLLSAEDWFKQIEKARKVEPLKPVTHSLKPRV